MSLSAKATFIPKRGIFPKVTELDDYCCEKFEDHVSLSTLSFENAISFLTEFWHDRNRTGPGSCVSSWFSVIGRFRRRRLGISCSRGIEIAMRIGSNIFRNNLRTGGKDMLVVGSNRAVKA